MALSAGDRAPEVTLPSHENQQVPLSSLWKDGPAVLLFFPLAFTSTCTAELCAMSEDYAQFQRGNTVVLPISVDSVPTLREFKAKEGMTVELLSDFHREVSRSYGVLNEAKFFSNRAYVLIDATGSVRWAYQEANNSERRENAELLAQMAALG